MTALSILVVGLLLGMQHATEVDHLAAVATLATRQSSLTQTLRQGVAWGIGHTLTLVLFGGVVLWLGQAIFPRLGQALETPSGSCWCCSAPTCCAGWCATAPTSMSTATDCASRMSMRTATAAKARTPDRRIAMRIRSAGRCAPWRSA